MKPLLLLGLSIPVLWLSLLAAPDLKQYLLRAFLHQRTPLYAFQSERTHKTQTHKIFTPFNMNHRFTKVV